MMLLPGVSLLDHENLEKIMNETTTRSAQNYKEKQAQKDQKAATSGAANAVQKMINRMTQPLISKIDYLTPLRKERE